MFLRSTIESLIKSFILVVITLTFPLSTSDFKSKGARSLSTLGRILLLINLSITSNGCACKFSYSCFKNGSAFHSKEDNCSNFVSSSILVVCANSLIDKGRGYFSLFTPLRNNSDAMRTNPPNRALSGAFCTACLPTWCAHRTGDFRDSKSSKIISSYSDGSMSGDDIAPYPALMSSFMLFLSASSLSAALFTFFITAIQFVFLNDNLTPEIYV